LCKKSVAGKNFRHLIFDKDIHYYKIKHLLSILYKFVSIVVNQLEVGVLVHVKILMSQLKNRKVPFDGSDRTGYSVCFCEDGHNTSRAHTQNKDVLKFIYFYTKRFKRLFKNFVQTAERIVDCACIQRVSAVEDTYF